MLYSNLDSDRLCMICVLVVIGMVGFLKIVCWYGRSASLACAILVWSSLSIESL